MAKSSTSFKNGNPGGGRKPLPLDVVQLCRSVTVAATEKLIEIMRMDAKRDAAILGVQARVCESLLNRGWGSAPQTVTLQGDITAIRIITPSMKADYATEFLTPNRPTGNPAGGFHV